MMDVMGFFLFFSFFLVSSVGRGGRPHCCLHNISWAGSFSPAMLPSWGVSILTGHCGLEAGKPNDRGTNLARFHRKVSLFCCLFLRARHLYPRHSLSLKLSSAENRRVCFQLGFSGGGGVCGFSVWLALSAYAMYVCLHCCFILCFGILWLVVLYSLRCQR